MKEIKKTFQTNNQQPTQIGLHMITDIAQKDIELLLDHLSKHELETYKNFPALKRQHSYLMGRYCAKKALFEINNKIKLAEITIENGYFDQPIVIHPNISNTQVSIAHTDNSAVALAFKEHQPMGVDLELNSTKMISIINKILPDAEKRLLKKAHKSCSDEIHTIVWACKESMSKTIKIGLFPVLSLYEIKKIEILTQNKLYKVFFKNFPQFETFALIEDDYVLAITSPKQTFIPQQFLDLQLSS